MLAVLAAIVALLLRPTFTASIAFIPGGSGPTPSSSSIAGLASQFGIQLASDPSQSGRFYADLLLRREILERAASSHYVRPSNGRAGVDSATLLDILDITGDSPQQRLFEGVKTLRGMITAGVDNGTGIVTLSVDSYSPELAAAIANRFVEVLNAFNTETRQTRARARRVFVSERLNTATSELRAAEDSLRIFYERNRSWQGSPLLTFEEGRRRRQVDMTEQVYATLERELETARIDEVNDTPVITVVEHASRPQEKSKPRRRTFVLAAFFLGGFGGVVWSILAEYLARLRQQDPEEYARFATAWSSARTQARAMLPFPSRRR